ncbi:hypothetical protein [Bdellovibrio sp. HCB337]|uniref:hypothetical protein n=1 Tax=Bdellovibrio sp. HCB337 TaxID=3394358 RepID=UPI0039A786AE
MTNKNIFVFIFSSVLLQLSSTMVWAYGNLNEGYQEVTYEELVNELNTKKSTVERKQKAPLSAISLGVGYVHSMTQLNIRHKTSERSQNGLQVAGSMHLDSPNLYAEGVFRNFSGSSITREDLQILQMDGRLGFTNDIVNLWKLNLFTGFSGRLIQASNDQQNYNVNEFTPSLTVGASAMASIHKNVRLGLEVGGRTSILGKNTDKNSVDFALRLDTSL